VYTSCILIRQCSGPLDIRGHRDARSTDLQQPSGLSTVGISCALTRHCRLYKTPLGALDRPDVRDYLEQSTARNIIDPLAKRLPGPDPLLRAKLITSPQVGSAAALDYYANAIQALIDEPGSRV
jgi:hypothetical protein